jgi:hypothetical protein
MVLLRLCMLAIALALGTTLLGWWAVPSVAFAYSLVMHRTPRPGFAAAAGGALAWGGYLVLASVGGAALRPFASALGTSMQLPAWAPLVATLAFPALLAGLAAYLGARVGARYLTHA